MFATKLWKCFLLFLVWNSMMIFIFILIIIKVTYRILNIQVHVPILLCHWQWNKCVNMKLKMFVFKEKQKWYPTISDNVSFSYYLPLQHHILSNLITPITGLTSRWACFWLVTRNELPSWKYWRWWNFWPQRDGGRSVTKNYEQSLSVTLSFNQYIFTLTTDDKQGVVFLFL